MVEQFAECFKAQATKVMVAIATWSADRQCPGERHMTAAWEKACDAPPANPLAAPTIGIAYPVELLRDQWADHLLSQESAEDVVGYSADRKFSIMGQACHAHCLAEVLEPMGRQDGPQCAMWCSVGFAMWSCYQEWLNNIKVGDVFARGEPDIDNNMSVLGLRANFEAVRHAPRIGRRRMCRFVRSCPDIIGISR